MRKVLPLLAMFASLISACSDTSPTSTRLSRWNSGLASLACTNEPDLRHRIDKAICDYFPKGLVTATGTRWDNIVSKLASGDVSVARSQFKELSKFIFNKAGDIAPGLGESKTGAAARLVYLMFIYVSGGTEETFPPLLGAGEDVAIAVVGTGEAALIQTPTKKAGLRLDALSTGEDRLIIIAQNPAEPTFAPRSGPLPTDRHQFPRFYHFASFPDKRLLLPGRFAVCHVLTGPSAPLEEEHALIRLAHNKPERGATVLEGAIEEGEIEILPHAESSTGVVDCLSTASATAPGIRGLGQRALYALAGFAEKLIAPKAAYAYDQGPEHFSDFFSDFNAVGLPDFTGFWNGTTRVCGAAPGCSPAGGQPITVYISGQTVDAVTGEYRVAQIGSTEAYNIQPGFTPFISGPGRFISSSSLAFSGLDFTIDPFYSPFSNGKKLEQTLTRSVSSDNVVTLSGTIVRTCDPACGLVTTDYWALTLTKAASPNVLLPPPPTIVSLRAAPTGTTPAKLTSDAPIQ